MFKISSKDVIKVVKLLQKSEKAIDHLEKSGGKNKIIYPKLKKDISKTTDLWKKAFELESFEQWKKKD